MRLTLQLPQYSLNFSCRLFQSLHTGKHLYTFSIRRLRVIRTHVIDTIIVEPF